MASQSEMSRRQGLEERNMARLNPVVALARVPESMTGWTKVVEIDALGPMTVTCIANQGHTVPHGLDGDVIFGLTAAFEFQGRPENRRLRLTLSQLCEYVGLAPGGTTFERIRSSLERLYKTDFHTEACWGVQRRGKWVWQSKSFHIIDSLNWCNEGSSAQTAKAFEPDTQMEISLGDEIVQSLQLGHTRWIDLATYHGLSFPLVRLLYRLLEEQQAIGNGRTFRVPVAALGEHLGLRELDPEGGTEGKYHVPRTRVIPIKRVRRALEPAHKELLEMGYLRAVDYEGRGQKQEITYTFGTSVQLTADVETVALLTRHGVTAVRAAELVRAHGRERVREACTQFEARLAAGYMPKNKAGLLCNMLEQPDRYATTVTAQPKAPSSPVKRGTESLNEQEAPVPERDERMAQLLLSSCALHQTSEGREQLAALSRAYLAGKVSTGDLIGIARLDLHDAIRRAEALLSTP